MVEFSEIAQRLHNAAMTAVSVPQFADSGN